MLIPLSSVQALHNKNFSDFSRVHSMMNHVNQKHGYAYIWNTIHYNYLKDEKMWGEVYSNYVTQTKQREHSLTKFNELRNTFDEEKLKEHKIVLKFIDNRLIVQDGVHRLSCYLFFTKKTYIPSEYVHICNVPLTKGLQAMKNTQIDLSPSSTYIKQQLYHSTKKIHSNGWGTFRNQPDINGYHSLQFCGLNIRGQRDCRKRLALMTTHKHISFEGKRILDLGCNVGGMLFHVENIQFGYGIDYDQNVINIANYIAGELSKQNILVGSKYNFKCMDLDKPATQVHVEQLCTNVRFDYIFLCSMGSWIKNWTTLCNIVEQTKTPIIFETNNDREGKPQLHFFKQCSRSIDVLIESSTDDNTGNFGRKTYLIL